MAWSAGWSTTCWWAHAPRDPSGNPPSAAAPAALCRTSAAARGVPAQVPTPLVADSFSLGVLLRYLLTGVPPGAWGGGEAGGRLGGGCGGDGCYVALRRYNPAWQLANALRSCAGRPAYRLLRLSELPAEAVALVSGLTEPDYHARLTMGDLGGHPWVKRAAAAQEETRRELRAAAQMSGRARQV